MNATPPAAKALFLAAIRLPPDAWPEFVRDHCGADADLRRLLEGLLDAHREAASRAADLGGTAGHQLAADPDRAGTAIGPYTLREAIGEGGMGVVYVADQAEPVRRRVALKVIKPGMDSKQVVARFEQERQALALMDHPNIARVFDGGATPDGRPYFVMELVRGLPVTDYCDQARLPTADRLRLVADVCRAVQHAHQKGVIHRDLKPSNVLVTVIDGKPVPKVIDFGIAKATGAALTDRTVYTGFAQLVGTPLYMSPEQAELSGVDVDTRADVYSLGVLLYELLTGTTPFSTEEARGAGLDELRRMIREDEPPRPSHRVITLDAKAGTTVSNRRGLDQRQLGRLLRGDLDWIVMTALEKDRNRRYESAGAFAADVERYLADEPVHARPPSAAYRLRKFARRNKGALLAASAVAVALLLAVASVAGSIGWVTRDRAVQRTETGERANGALREAAFFQSQARWSEALAAARKAEAILGNREDQPALLQEVRDAVADLKMVATLEEVRLRSAAAVRDDLFDWQLADAGYSQAFREYGIDVEALEAEEAAERIRARSVRGELVAALDDWTRMAIKGNERRGKHVMAVARAADPRDEWRNRLRVALTQKDRKSLQDLAALVPVGDQSPMTLSRLGGALLNTGAPEDAVAFLRKAQQRHPGDFWINHGLAFALTKAQPPRLEEAVRFYTAALALRPQSPGVYLNYGKALSEKGALDEAIAANREAIRLKPDYAAAYNNLATVFEKKMALDEAIAASREAIRLAPNEAACHLTLGNVLKRKGRLDEAITAYRAAVRLNPEYAAAHMELGNVLDDKGLLDEAISEHRTAIRLQPDNSDAHNNLGCALGAKGALDEAIAEFREAIRLRPDSIQAHTNLGGHLLEKGALDEGIAQLREATRVKPDYAGAHYTLGLGLARKGALDEAIVAYREAVRLEPDAPGARINLGNALLRKGELAAAIAAHRAWVRHQPRSASAHNNLAWQLANCQDPRLRDPFQAVRLAGRAVELAPKQWSFWNTLGVAHYRAGDWKAAVAALEQSMKLRNGGDGDDWFILAMAHWQLGDREKARGWYDKAVQWMDKNRPPGDDLRRLRAEAAELLGVKVPPTEKAKP